MFSLTALAAFATACFVLAVVPGPVVSAIVAQSLARGTSAGLAVLFGTQIANLTMIIVVALGMQTIVAFMGWAFDWVKLIGAAYLIWIGISMLRSTGEKLGAGKVRERSRRQLAVQGFFVLWSNPKALVFFGAFLPQFVDPARSTFWQTVVLGLLFTVIAGLSDAGYAILAGTARNAFTKARVRTLSRVAGAVLIGGGIWLALAKRS
jgi:threonine/homoserine/homoserine lactone efflux protein